MNSQTQEWSTDPLIWGNGERQLEVFLEPTCPFSAKAFSKFDDLLEKAGPDNLSIRIWLHSQPWHLFSGVVCRAILAASTGNSGKKDAKQVMSAVFANRADFEFEDHRTGPNLDTTPNNLIHRIEQKSGVGLAENFQLSGLEKELKLHTRYARQNGIHESPTFIIDGLIDPGMSSGQSVDEWHQRMFGS